MNTELIITDITRMAEPFICIAGIDNQGRTFRPIYEHGRIDESWCCQGNKVIKPFTRISINLARQRHPILAPHTEDWFIGPGEITVIGDCSEEEKLRVLVDSCSNDAASIFGAPIHHVEQQGNFIEEGTGNASLGAIHVQSVANFSYHFYEKSWDYRATLKDESGMQYRLKSVDLFFQTFIDHLRVCKKWENKQIENYVNNKIFIRSDIYLRIGLARRWADHPDCCNLQITGLYTFPDYMQGKSFHDLRREIRAVQ